VESIIISVLNRTIMAGTPLLLGTLGEIMTERSGVLNLGVEGMMALGAVTGFIVAFTSGSPWLGLVAGVVAGAFISIIHAYVCISLRASQVVSGLALTMLGLGISGMWGKPFIGRPLTTKIEAFKIPLLGDLPFIGEVLFEQDVFFFFSIVLGFILWFLLSRTKWGIRVRSVGENPQASETQGVNVSAIRYLCVAVGGACAGMAGAHLSLSYNKSWAEGLTGGRGWIVIALTIFTLWNPLRAFVGAFLFGGIFVLQYLLQPLGIPPNFLGMLPYISTLGVLLLGGLRKGHRMFAAPAVLGEPYTKGER
jgi:ABC-type uncharacterized transport system permease subunit